jgi:hypothetical protein
MAKDGKVRVTLDPVYDQVLIDKLSKYAHSHTRGKITAAARELMIKGLAK